MHTRITTGYLQEASRLFGHPHPANLIMVRPHPTSYAVGAYDSKGDAVIFCSGRNVYVGSDMFSLAEMALLLSIGGRYEAATTLHV